MGKEKSVNTLKRVVWLLDTIYKAGDEGITRSEINEKWMRNVELSGGLEYPVRTFRHHLDEIENIFDIDIECISGRKYRVPYSDGMDIDALTNWVVNSISIRNIVVNNTKLRERILFEPIPAGGRLLQPILDAMDFSVEVVIRYKRFDSEKAEKYTVQPYFLKLFRRRWYLVGQCEEMGEIYTFSLDRTQSVVLTKRVFEMPEIDESDFFGNSFGIMWKKNSAPERVQIIVYGDQIDYIKSAPLHESQREIKHGVQNGRNYSVFEYDLHITYDFAQELLSHGKSLRVMEPDSLKKEMMVQAAEMLRYYR